MGLTLTEKILGRASGKSVSPGDVVEINVDLAAFHDLTGYHVVEVMEKMGGVVRVWDVNKFVLAFDHLAPPPTERAAEIQVGLGSSQRLPALNSSMMLVMEYCTNCSLIIMHYLARWLWLLIAIQRL